MKKIDRILDLFVPRAMLITAIALWTLALSASLVWNVYHSKKTTIELAVNEAIVHFQKDMDFGRWGARYGGLYVPVSEEVKPSRFLSRLPERDIVTSSGQKLTLVNPVYMLRGFLDKNSTIPGGNTSITSLKPLNPENRPDPWQMAALLSFESGVSEAVTIDEYEGETSIRFMKPVIAEMTCLKCHESQGYREGDIRGGISVSVPLYNFQSIAENEIRHFNLTHAFIWLLGTVGILRGWAGIRQHNEAKQKAFEELEKSKKLATHLNSRLIDAHETERKRISIEVHDDVCQIIIASKYLVENAVAKIKKNDFEEVEEQLNRAVSVLQQVISKVRNLEKNLVPPSLKDLGLIAALLSFIRDFVQDFPGIRVKTNIGLNEDDVSPHLKTTIFRIAQEAFRNIARHSDAQNANLSFVKLNGQIKLTISDNGKGFEADSIYDENHPLMGMGLASIKERTEFSGGVFEIRTGPGMGTIINCIWPC